jgi:hypothetical protein
VTYTTDFWIAVSLLATGYVFIPAFILGRAASRRRRKSLARRELQATAEETARRHAEVIEESRKAIDSSRNPAVMAAHFDVIQDHAEKLSALAEHYDLPDIPPSTPADLKIFYRNEKDRILLDRTMEQVDAALTKADEIPRRNGKITYLERALILCLEGKRTTRDQALSQAFDERASRVQEAIAAAISAPKSG